MNLDRKRNKPLRTYGRQPTDTRDEPPAKRRKSAHEEAEPDYTKAKGTSEDTDTLGTERTTNPGDGEPSASPEKPPKGSILNYFQRQLLPAAISTPKSEPCPESSNTPPSAPRIVTRKIKAPGLLRIRPATVPVASTDKHEGEEEHSGSEKENEHQNNKSKDAPRGVDGAKRLHLSDANSNINTTPQNMNHDNPKQQPAKQPKPKNTVQTTLNLSSRPAFSECKVCDTVWNPLCPDDTRYHSRRHAAIVRKQKMD